ncbi:peptidase T [candidate division KSB1 bacterium]|nr:peptidase T [candidate division KSB1 bacterium]
MAKTNINYTVVDRFLKYTTFDTQSSETSDTFPSTEKQKLLGEYLVKELTEMGLKDAKMDQYGYVTATLPANCSRNIPTIGLIAHMDTSPDVSGKGVKAVIHGNYQGGDIVVPGDTSQVLSFDETADLKNQIGNDIITSDGTTLLGADNKAGIAEIFDAINHLIQNPDIEHGKIRIAVTPDEEVGNGTKYFNVEEFGADFAYTIDGESAGEIENETFCADSVVIKIHGYNVHPGYAKNKLVNSIKIMSELIDQLPEDRLSPETTEGRQGYVHPHGIEGNVETSTVKFLIRDFTVEGLKENEAFLKNLAEKVVYKYPKTKLEFDVSESYRNMKYKLDDTPHVTEFAIEAIERSNMKPKLGLIRGGTDGSRLSYMGLPTPNIFTGGHNFHSKLEWISVQDMQKAVDVIVNLVQVWAEKA